MRSAQSSLLSVDARSQHVAEIRPGDTVLDRAVVGAHGSVKLTTPGKTRGDVMERYHIWLARSRGVCGLAMPILSLPFGATPTYVE